MREQEKAKQAKARTREKARTKPSASGTKTAWVRDLRSDEVFPISLSGEALGLCLPGPEGMYGLSAPPELSMEELKARVDAMEGLLSQVSLVPGELASLPLGAIFALPKVGTQEGSTNLMDYELLQLVEKDATDYGPVQ